MLHPHLMDIGHHPLPLQYYMLQIKVLLMHLRGQEHIMNESMNNNHIKNLNLNFIFHFMHMKTKLICTNISLL